LNFNQLLTPSLFDRCTATAIINRHGGRNFSALGPRAVPKILTRLGGGLPETGSLNFLIHNFNNATFDSFWSFPEANALLNGTKWLAAFAPRSELRKRCQAFCVRCSNLLGDFLVYLALISPFYIFTDSFISFSIFI
jgi:hypothetical protein